MRNEEWFSLIENIIYWAPIVYKALCAKCYQEEQSLGKNIFLNMYFGVMKNEPQIFFLL